MFKKQSVKKEQSEGEFLEVLDLTKQKIPATFTKEEKGENNLSIQKGDMPRYNQENYFEKSEENISLGDNYSPTKWAKAGKFLLYLLIFLLPLFFLPFTPAPVAINKQFFLAALVILSFICYAADILAIKQIIYPKSWLALAVFGVLVSAVLSAAFSQDRISSIYGNLVSPDSLINFVLYFLIFWLAAVFFRKDDFKKIGIAFFSGFILTVLLFLISVFGFKILPFNFAKQAGFNTIGLVSDLGIFIAFGLISAVAVFSEIKLSLVSKIILIFASLLGFIALVVLNSQTLWLEIAVAMIVFAAYKFITVSEYSDISVGDEGLKEKYSAEPKLLVKNPPRRLAVSREAGFIFNVRRRAGQANDSPALPMAIIILSLFFALVGPSFPPLMDAPVQIKPGLNLNWSVAKEVLKGSRAIIGSGPATFIRDYAVYRPIETNQGDFWMIGFNQGYSFMATILATAGVFGILAFLFLFYFFFRKLVKNLDNKELLAASFGIMILIIGLFIEQASLTQLIFIFLGLGLMMAFSGSVGKISIADISKTRAFLSFIGLIIAITAGLGLFYLIGQKYVAAAYYERGIDSYGKSQDMEKTLADIYKAISLDADSGQYLRVFSQYLLLDAETQNVKINNLSKTSSDSEEAKKITAQVQNDLALAVNAAQKATVVNPADSANWSNLGNVYERIMFTADGADQFAAEDYRKAMALDPKNPELPLSLARVLLSSAARDKETNPKNTAVYQNKIAEAKDSLDKAIALKPDYASAYFQKAAAYMQEGKIKEAAQELENTQILAPSDSGVAFQLGALYYNDGQLDKAQAELERAVALNSEYSNARYILGLVYAKQGAKDKAIAQFEKVLKLNPGNQEVSKILDDLKNNKFDAGANATPSPLPEKSPTLPVDENIKK